MTSFDRFASMPETPGVDPLRMATAVHLARYNGATRLHTESDLRIGWCVEHKVDPLAARRPDVELYVRWLQEARRFRPSTASRRLSVVAGFYRTCVMTGCSGPRTAV